MSRQNLTLDNIETFSIPFDEHPLKWKFQDENGANPSAEFLDQIIPLSSDASIFLWEFVNTQKILNDKFVDTKYLKIEKNLAL